MRERESRESENRGVRNSPSSESISFLFVTYTLANMPPKACFECKPARTIWTLMGLDIVMHVHMIIKMLLGHEPSFTDAAYIGRFIKMHFISVAFESLLSGKRSTAEFTRQNLELANVCATCLLYTSPSPRDHSASRMPSSA